MTAACLRRIFGRMQKPLFEIVTTTAGAVSIRNNEVNETMHNPVGPWVESNALYIAPSRLAERLQEKSSDDFVIYDVGLGAAANALAALHCAAQIKNRRNLKMISFERDLTLLRFALDHAAQFEHFKGYEQPIETLLKDKVWFGPGIEWTLHEGDFLECLPHEKTPAHLVFFDPYSPKKNADMWSIDVFQKILQHCDSNEGALLMTYSRATPIRVALFAAGFYVGAGTGIGLKDETTQASTHLRHLVKPLGAEFLDRWSRSQSPHPWGSPPEQLESLRQQIEKHPQFAH